MVTGVGFGIVFPAFLRYNEESVTAGKECHKMDEFSYKRTNVYEVADEVLMQDIFAFAIGLSGSVLSWHREIRCITITGERIFI